MGNSGGSLDPGPASISYFSLDLGLGQNRNPSFLFGIKVYFPGPIRLEKGILLQSHLWIR